ncbi:MAG: hypothetical protein H6609_20175 [Ignavibacteriales bacterium]|nr:hypothetical protein [Ignavibacteriales bacterium]
MKKSMAIIFTVLITIFFNNTFLAQDIIIKKDGTEESFLSLNPRIENRFGTNINILGPTVLLSFSIDYFVTPDINIETGLGIMGYFGGIKYHLFGNDVNKKWTPYLGI